jgi:hypothetical protein
MKLNPLTFVWTAAALALGGGTAMAAPASNADAEKAIRQELAEPFCYFRAPTDQIGFKNCPKATIITYDGAFISPYGQLSFYVGAPGKLRPINQRVKTFLDNHLPVIQFSFERDGLRYDFEAFATPIGLDPKGNQITFIGCTVSNPGKKEQAGMLGVNFGEIDSKINVDPAFGWFLGQRQGLKRSLGGQRSTTWHTQQFMDEVAFNAGKAQIAVADGQLRQSGHLVCTVPAEGVKPGMPSLDSQFKEAAAEYAFTVKPGEKQVFRFKMPANPTALAKPEAIKEVVEADHDDYRAKTIAFWKAEIAKADRFFVDDPKVMNTFKSSLVNDLIASELSAEGMIYQRVNKIHYNAFWIRDGAYFARTYDMLGLHDTTRLMLNAFFVWQDGKPVGFFKPGAPQPKGARLSVQDDYWGQVLWAIGAHCRTTGDRALLEMTYPLLQAHVDEFTAKCAKDPRGLWPVAGPYDNEAINGHYTGHSFWALLGLKYAVFMANEMGKPEDAAKWQKVHDDYAANFLKQLRELAAKADGYIPPGMDTVYDGNDWDNACGGLFPFEVLAKDDPLARQTIAMVRNYNYQEGIITYGGNAWVARQRKQQGQTTPRGTLHHYEIFYVTESNTILGEQRKVVEDLYSILAHTGSTNSGFEFCIPAWSTRDPGGNFTPHGWFANRYMCQIRNLLVREEGTQVHLASVLAPLWVKAGKQVKVADAPTFFGSVSYVLDCQKKGAILTLSNHWKEKVAPTAIVFHIPWFLKVSKATIDGQAADFAGNVITLAPNAKQLELKWSWIDDPNLSYDEAVRLYLEKYYKKPVGADYDFLFPVVRPPVLKGQTGFIATTQVELVTALDKTTIHYTLDGSIPTAKSPAFRKPITIIDTTTLKAICVGQDGQISDTAEYKIEKLKPKPAVAVPQTAPGLAYAYYEGKMTSLDQIANLQPIRKDITKTLLHDGFNNRQDDFAFVFEGYLQVPATGLYEFALKSDDGSRLILDGQTIVNNDGLHPPTRVAGGAALQAGLHKVRIEYFDAVSLDILEFTWTKPGDKAESPVPATAFSH